MKFKKIKKYGYYQSPIGLIEITSFEDQITALNFTKTKKYPESDENYFINQAKIQLDAYFKKKNRRFTLPFMINGTYFEEAVWSKIYQIPYGKTATYQELAIMIANPKAIGAVASAVNKNKLAFIIPCHRVISKNKTSNYLLSQEKQIFLQKLETSTR